MNNEKYNQIVDDAYKSYKKKVFRMLESWDAKYSEILKREADGCRPYSQDIFIKRIRTDAEFSEKWGLKIEERELSNRERNEWFQIHLNGNNPFMKSDWKDFELDQQNIPAKLITITYNNEVVEVYE